MWCEGGQKAGGRGLLSCESVRALGIRREKIGENLYNSKGCPYIRLA